MIDHSAWITRIAEEAEDLQGKVFDTAQYYSDVGGWKDSPIVYVGPHIDEAGTVYQVIDNQAGRQTVLAVIAVLIVVKASTESPKTFDVNTARVAVRNALTLWIPDGAYDEVRFAGGANVDIIDEFAVWQDRYVTRHFI